MTNKAEDLLEEIRDLLLLIAEPALARRDEQARSKIREIAGRGKKKQDAIMQMNGTQTRPTIVEVSGIDPGGLSRLISDLRAAGVMQEEGGKPRITVALPSTFFEPTEVQP